MPTNKLLDSILKILQSNNLKFKQNQSSLILSCPICGKADKLYIRKEGGFFKCFYCDSKEGFKGKVEYALSKLLHLTINEVKSKLYGDELYLSSQDGKLQFEINDDQKDKPLEFDLPTIQCPLDFYNIDHKFSINGLKYLENRGVSLEIAKFYNIKYCPPRRRIIFPVESEGKLFGWQARTIDQTEYFDTKENIIYKVPKILTSPNLRRDRCLMFMDRLKNSPHCILTEGPFDAISCHLAKGNVCSMGKQVTKYQIDLIRSYNIKKLYIALDPDAANEIVNLIDNINDLELYSIEPTKGYKDLGDMNMNEVYKLFLNARRIDRSNIVFYLKDTYITR